MRPTQLLAGDRQANTQSSSARGMPTNPPPHACLAQKAAASRRSGTPGADVVWARAQRALGVRGRERQVRRAAGVAQQVRERERGGRVARVGRQRALQARARRRHVALGLARAPRRPR